MSWLLDVNLILATRWTTHPDHTDAQAWLDSLSRFYTTAITELGFVRISLSTAYGANWQQVQASLRTLQLRPAYAFLTDDINGTDPPETSSKDSTDAHLVTLATRHGLRLATLDVNLIAKSWSAGVAVNPLTTLTGP